MSEDWRTSAGDPRMFIWPQGPGSCFLCDFYTKECFSPRQTRVCFLQRLQPPLRQRWLELWFVHLLPFLFSLPWRAHRSAHVRKNMCISSTRGGSWEDYAVSEDEEDYDLLGEEIFSRGWWWEFSCKRIFVLRYKTLDCKKDYGKVYRRFGARKWVSSLHYFGLLLTLAPDWSLLGCSSTGLLLGRR